MGGLGGLHQDGEYAVVNVDTGEILCRSSSRKDAGYWRVWAEKRRGGNYGVIRLEDVVEVP